MGTTVTIEEAQSHLRELISRLTPGEELGITENQRMLAKLVAADVPSRKPRHPGSAKGKLTILSDDDEHLNDFTEYMR